MVISVADCGGRKWPTTITTTNLYYYNDDAFLKRKIFPLQLISINRLEKMKENEGKSFTQIKGVGRKINTVKILIHWLVENQ